MRKHIISAFVAAALLFTMAGAAFAAGDVGIAEMPDIKFVVDGKLVKCENVPISVENNTLLPLRELMAILGVPNDDAHIIYNDSEKSVTVLSDKTKIVLYAGKQDAYIGGKPVKLDAAPVIYGKKQLLYIPFKPMAEALGKKIVWDGSSRAILICDAEKYAAVKELLDKSNEAAAKIDKLKFNMEVTALARSESASTKLGIVMAASTDRLNKKMSMNTKVIIPGMEVTTDSYYANNAAYTRESFSGIWYREAFAEDEYNRLFEEQGGVDILKTGELLCAGLNEVPAENDDEILLKGDVYLSGLFKNPVMQQDYGYGLSMGNDMYEFDKSAVEILLDKNTYLVKHIIMNFEKADHDLDIPLYTTITTKILYSEYNGNFEITIPEEAIKNAVEKTGPSTPG